VNDYSLFLEEVFGISTLEADTGFCTYRISGTVFSIKDVYVRPEFRGQKESLVIVDHAILFAKEHGCKICTVIISKAAKERVQERTKHLCQLKQFTQYEEDSMHFYFRKDI
jgi:GNAT superfamily N-acetyltransferase